MDRGTLAIFQLSGKQPVERDKLKSCESERASTSMPTLRKKTEIKSVP